MTTGISPPTPILSFLGNDGKPLFGGAVATFIGGLPAATYSDVNLTVPLPNPIPLNSRGEISTAVGTSSQLFLTPNQVYTFTLFDAAGNQVNTATYVTTTQGLSSLTGQLVGQALYPQNAAEQALSVTPTNYQYPYLNVKRYGAVGDGVTDDRAAILTAWQVAVQQGGGTIVLPDGATYSANSYDPNGTTMTLPSQNSDGSNGTQPTSAFFYFKGGSNINFDFQGSTAKAGITGGGQFFLFDACTNIRLIRPRFLGLQVMSTGVVTTGSLVGGSGYTGGSYNNVPLTGGTGGGAVAGIVVSSGAVQSVVISYPGGNYVVGDTLSCSNANIGGTGSGFQITVTSVTGAGPVPLADAPNAVVLCGLTGPISDFTCYDLNCEAMFTGFLALSSNGSANTITKISLVGTTKIRNGYYGIALQNGGDNTDIENYRSYRLNRPLFIYGAQNVTFNCTSEQNNLGFQSICKAYSRSTANINGMYTMLNAPGQSSSVQSFAIQVQCDPAVISPPPTVQNVYLKWAEINFINGGANVQFDYFAGTGGLVQTATSANLLFNNIVIQGFSNQKLQTTVQLTTAAAFCNYNVDGFTYTRPASSSNDLAGNNGFIASRKFTYTPALNFGGAATGWTYSTHAADYYIAGGFCDVIGQFVVTGTGSATGAATITTPFPTRSDSSRNPVGECVGVSGMSGLSSPMKAYMSSGTSNINLVLQGTTSTSTVTDGNFSGSSNFIFQIRFPL